MSESKPIRLCLAQDQRISDTESLPPGTFVAEVKINPELPFAVGNMAFVAGGLQNGRLIAEEAMPDTVTKHQAKAAYAPPVSDVATNERGA